MSRRALAIGLLAALALACASDGPPARHHAISMVGADEHRQSTTRESYELLEYVNDPIEPVNRASFALTRGVVDWLVRPLAIGWRTVFPEPLRTGIDNFAYNLEFPDRFVSLLLLGQPAQAGLEITNFLVNSTLGLAGFVDAATPLGMPSHEKDVGCAFGAWGFGPGFYLFLPLLGPSSGRDGLGRIFDTALSPATYVPAASLLFLLNGFSSHVETYDVLTASGMDLYLPVRLYWAVDREIQVSDYQIPESAWRDADPNPSLGILLATLDDESFPSRQEQRAVRASATGQRLPYSLWLQEPPAPIVFIVPGIGAHRSATNAVQLAESAWRAGLSAVIVSSPFHPEFIRRGLSATYAGYTPSDAEDLYRALGEIRADIEERTPGRVTSASLLGYSLGAVEALFVSQLERRASEPGALHFERVVAINPAVDLEAAAGRFDGYFEAPLAWPAEQRRDRTAETVKKAFMVYRGSETEEIVANGTLPFRRDESDFLIGLSSRATTLQAIAASRERGGAGLGVLPGDVGGFHGPFEAEVESSSLERYMRELAIPYFVEKEGGARSAQELFGAANLTSQEAGLRDDPRLRVFTNRDDFLLAPGNLAWLRSVFGERISVSPGGGHLGNMHRPESQAAFVAALGTAPRN